MENIFLRLQDIEKTFKQADKKQHVLCGINATFEQGKSYSITGVSGSGKSTLLHILGGIDFPSSGKVIFNGKDLNNFSKTNKERFLKENIGFVFQFHYLIRELSVLENVMLPGLICGQKYSTASQKALSLLKSVGLENKAKQYSFELSGGEQQRVSIIRAIFNKPKFLLADEPTGDLDEENALQIVNLLIKCQKEWGLGLIICSHDKYVYSKMQKVFRLHEGKLQEI